MLFKLCPTQENPSWLAWKGYYQKSLTGAQFQMVFCNTKRCSCNNTLMYNNYTYYVREDNALKRTASNFRDTPGLLFCKFHCIYSFFMVQCYVKTLYVNASSILTLFCLYTSTLLFLILPTSPQPFLALYSHVIYICFILYSSIKSRNHIGEKPQYLSF